MALLRHWLAFFSVVLLVSLALPANIHAAPPSQAAIEVKMVEFSFQPQTVTITAGQSVAWTNAGSVNHTTTSENQSGDANCCWNVTVQPGFTYERVFTEPGTYNYYCSFHRAQGMTGVVVVQPAQGAATSTPTQTPTVTSVPAGPTNTPGGPTATATQTTTAGPQPQFFIIKPTEGEAIEGSNVQIQIDVQNLTLREPGTTPPRANEGFFSLFLDDRAEVRTGDRNYTFSNVAAGNHQLRVELRRNDGTPYTPPIQASVAFRTVAPGQAVTPPAVVTGIATQIGPTSTVGLPATGDGSYPGDGPGAPLWLLAAAPLALFGVALAARARRGNA